MHDCVIDKTLFKKTDGGPDLQAMVCQPLFGGTEENNPLWDQQEIGGLVEIKLVCWEMVFVPPAFPMRSQHWSVMALPKGDPLGPRCTWHLQVLHLGSLGCRDI